MSFWKLIFRNLRFYNRSHFGTLLGAIIGSAVLIGALVVGDSVKESLREQTFYRLGDIQSVLRSGDRLFRTKLAAEMGKSDHAAVLRIQGIVSTVDQSARANRVQLFGVSDDFWQLSPGATRLSEAVRYEKEAGERNRKLDFLTRKIRTWYWRIFPRQPDSIVARIDSTRTSRDIAGILRLGRDWVFINQALAKHLNVKRGDLLTLRFERTDSISKDNPLAPQEGLSTVVRVRIAGLLADQSFGKFNLEANQQSPFNAFLFLNVLQTNLNAIGRANLLLSRNASSDEPLRKHWQLADAQLELRELNLLPSTLNSQPTIELRSERIFLDEPISKAALSTSSNATGILTYFVNELRVGKHTTPYSMVTAANEPIIPADIRDDEILVNQWLADDLQAKPGDELSLRYFVMGTSQRLEEKTNSFRIRAVVPMEGVYADRELMPEFPGIAKAEKTENWDAGFAIDMKKIRQTDEAYWRNYRGTPKAFVTLAAGQKMWANRFGNLTAVRYQSAADFQSAEEKGASAGRMPAALSKTEIESALLRKIDPASIGLRFENVRERALKAVEQSQDFGGLFLGLSFFLIVAALVLMALLFQFSLEQRTEEVGTLLALGFRPAQVRRLFLAEGFVVALIGGIVGTLVGLAYARGMLWGLSTVWRSAVAGSAIQFHVSVSTLLIGFASSAVVSALTIWIVLRRHANRSARELLGGESEWQIADGKPSRRKIAEWICAICGISGIAMVGWAIWKNESDSSETFFSAGSLLLVAGLAAVAILLKRLLRSDAAAKLSLAAMGLRSTTRRRKRSLATVALLASGTFLIVAVGAFRLESDKDSAKPTSGTGGFALIGETTLPVVQNLNEKSGREFFGLDERDLPGVKFVPFRVHEGDEASCLNLNRAQKPRVLGVKLEAFMGRFSWAIGVSREELRKLDPSEVSGFADEASIVWALAKKVGDTIDYQDERGEKFKIRLEAALKNSILQGSVIIDEAEFLKRFPNETGYRMFLIDVPSKDVGAVSEKLSRAMRDVGLELTPTTERLAQLNAVQNTYLSTFQILGGLGLLLGSAGLGVVVLRNVLERRGELALLKAVGFRERALRQLVLSEHAALLGFGLLVGVIGALLAILPALISKAELPYESLGLTLAGVFLVGLFSTWFATKWALRGELLKALRNE